VPEHTALPELLSFNFGYTELRGNNSNTDWSKVQIEVNVSRYHKNRKMVDVVFFRYQYHDSEPVEMFEFDLQNNDVVSVRVRRQPSFTDYVGVVAPVISVIATSFLLIENLRGN
jgi:hypothetical protein